MKKEIICGVCNKRVEVDSSWVGQECNTCFEEQLRKELLAIAEE